MRSVSVGIRSPSVQFLLGFGQGQEAVLIQALRSQLTIGRFDGGIVRQPAWTDEVQFNAMSMGSLVRRLRCKLRTIVYTNHPRPAAPTNHMIQRDRNIDSRESLARAQRQTFPGEVIRQGQEKLRSPAHSRRCGYQSVHSVAQMWWVSTRP